MQQRNDYVALFSRHRNHCITAVLPYFTFTKSSFNGDSMNFRPASRSKQSFKTTSHCVRAKRYAFQSEADTLPVCALSYARLVLLLWPRPSSDDLDIRTWPRYSEDVCAYRAKSQDSSQGFQRLEHEQDRQTRRQSHRQTIPNVLHGRIRRW